MKSQTHIAMAFIASVWFANTTTPAHADTETPADTGIEFGAVTYKTARMVVDADLDVVVERLQNGLAKLDIAGSYERFLGGATREQMIAGGRKANPDKKYYQVFQVLWDMPIFIDTGERKRVRRFGIGGGPGRPLIGKYPAAGLHVLTDINLYADGDKTVIDVLLPSGKYHASFAEEPGLEDLAQRADEKMIAFLTSLQNQ
jgi:hypothetical protein